MLLSFQILVQYSSDGGNTWTDVPARVSHIRLSVDGGVTWQGIKYLYQMLCGTIQIQAICYDQDIRYNLVLKKGRLQRKITMATTKARMNFVQLTGNLQQVLVHGILIPLYFCTDTNRIYLGTALMSRPAQVVATLPESGQLFEHCLYQNYRWYYLVL